MKQFGFFAGFGLIVFAVLVCGRMKRMEAVEAVLNRHDAHLIRALREIQELRADLLNVTGLPPERRVGFRSSGIYVLTNSITTDH